MKEELERVETEAPLSADRNPGTDASVGAPRETVRGTTKKPRRHVVFLLVVLFLVLLGAAFWMFKDTVIGWFVKQPVNQQNTTTQTIKKADIQVDISAAASEQLKKFITPTTGETWFPEAKKIDNQGWLLVEDISTFMPDGSSTTREQAQLSLNDAKPTYQEVGKHGDATIVSVFSPSEGLSGWMYVFEKSPDGKVTLILKPSGVVVSYPEDFQYIDHSINKKVIAVDSTTNYDSLTIPTELKLENGDIITNSTDRIFDSFASTPVGGSSSYLVSRLGGSTLYRRETKYVDTGLTNIAYDIETPLKTRVGLEYRPIRSSLEGYTFDNKAPLQYKDYSGKLVYDNYHPIATGCGGTGTVVTRSDTVKESDLVQIGRNSEGKPIYELKDKNSALYKKAYDEYSQTKLDAAVDFQAYVTAHAMVVMKDKAGEWLVFIRDQYAPVKGCAKPVVYLYPTRTTTVNVAVGAAVTVSDPLYEADGWRGVIAEPSGQLTYRGKQFDSLFWEGTGYGNYPGIVSGTVVKHADAATTIRAQLRQQGLNDKETTDFMAFWESKIPNMPYVRLTWFGTEEMNALAPLRVTPRPQTTLRVFLDMAGYDTKISLPAQKLKTTPRRGFTLVEWGGLATEVRR